MSVAKSFSSDNNFFKSRDRNIRVTERMQLLLSSDESIQITEKVIAAASRQNEKMIKILLGREDSRITEGALKKVVSEGKRRWRCF